jgi:hypothetical protein
MLPCRLRRRPCTDRSARGPRGSWSRITLRFSKTRPLRFTPVELEHVLGDIDARVSIHIAALLPVAGSQPVAREGEPFPLAGAISIKAVGRRLWRIARRVPIAHSGDIRDRVIWVALDEPALSPRELACASATGQTSGASSGFRHVWAPFSGSQKDNLIQGVPP